MNAALNTVSNVLIKKHYKWNWSEMSFSLSSIFCLPELARDTGNAGIKWYGFRLSSRHCTFKTVVKCICLARKKRGWRSKRCHVSTSNWEIGCGLYASLFLWSETLTFSFPLPPSYPPTCSAEKNDENAQLWLLPGCCCHLVI